MKWLAILLVVVAVIVAWQMNFFEPAAAKAYRAHTERAMERGGYSDDLVSPAKWSIDIENCSVSGDQAEIRAIVKTGTIPQGAASLAFATIVTRTIDVEMEKRGGRWVVAKEKVVSEDVSTYEDRKGAQLDR
jgi:peptidoglycan/LPS O-acetylase OafA/YrhL